ncbi:MAG: phosphoribosylanthranilate isomerase [Desulfobacterales bacterium]|nr:phosphoribosylanthranilate isomerase [Desulfobacterales bacterium]
MKPSPTELYRPQVKICGLTSPEAALACAELGVDAIGCVFFPKSPRHLSERQAREICAVLPPEVKKVGVFVNETYLHIMQKVERCGLTVVQLHGQESPELVHEILNKNIPVIKALFTAGVPSFSDAQKYRASAFLVECGSGILPGGNALTWDWQQARKISETYPLILAGGLSPDNVSQAIAACRPAAVDVSSGVEKAPGIKDLTKVKAFLDSVFCSKYKEKLNKVF